MKNYKLTIQYDGTDFAGWQIQSNAPTIQQHIIDAAEILLKEKINLIGSGRTDTGVHAFGQVANFRTGLEIDSYKFVNSLNALLPGSISIINMEQVDESFHARFDATKRSYLYFITSAKSPFYNKYSYKYNRIGNEEIDALNKLSRHFIGTHDFTSMSRKESDVKNRNSTIFNIHWRKGNHVTTFYVEANRFLHGMVRTLVGTLLYTVDNSLNEKYLDEVLNAKDRTAAAESVPSKGLFLYKVRY